MSDLERNVDTEAAAFIAPSGATGEDPNAPTSLADAMGTRNSPLDAPAQEPEPEPDSTVFDPPKAPEATPTQIEKPLDEELGRPEFPAWDMMAGKKAEAAGDEPSTPLIAETADPDDKTDGQVVYAHPDPQDTRSKEKTVPIEIDGETTEFKPVKDNNSNFWVGHSPHKEDWVKAAMRPELNHKLDRAIHAQNEALEVAGQDPAVQASKKTITMHDDPETKQAATLPNLGTSLRELLDQGKISQKEAGEYHLRAFQDAAQLLARDVFYKDANPGNIIIDPNDDRLTLIDFTNKRLRTTFTPQSLDHLRQGFVKHAEKNNLGLSRDDFDIAENLIKEQLGLTYTEPDTADES